MAPDFDRIARAYRWLEYLTLGRTLERCRFQLLPQLLDCRDALVFGDGDGRFLARLLAERTTLCADAVDTSATMLELLRARCAASSPEYESRLRTHHSDALDFIGIASPAVRYDLVVTHFFLDCLSQAAVEALVVGVASRLAPGAVWVVSEFRIPGGWMRTPARLVVEGLYLAFRMLTGLRTRQLPDHAGALGRAGFVCIERREFLRGLILSELWEFVHVPGRDGLTTRG